MLILTVLLQIFPAASDVSHYSSPGCGLWKNNYSNTFQDGDFIVGAVLQLSDFHWRFPPSQTEYQKNIICMRTSFQFYRHLLVFKFAIEEINRSSWILPNVTLGYQIFDSCAAEPKALSGALDIISGGNYKIPNFACLKNMKLIGILGDLSHVSSYPIAQLAGIFKYPQVSYGTTDPVYNNRIQFPSFYRTVPNEVSEMDGIVQMLKHFGWKWVGLIISDSESGERALDRIRKGIESYGGCVAFSIFLTETIYFYFFNFKILIDKIDKKGVDVIVLVLTPLHVKVLVRLFSLRQVTRKIWLTSSFFPTVIHFIDGNVKTLLNGTLSLSDQGGEIPGFEPFLYRMTPINYPNDDVITMIWETLHRCSFTGFLKTNTSVPVQKCSGNESLNNEVLSRFGKFDFRTGYQVYTAVYALAHALHNLLSVQTPTHHLEPAGSLNDKFKPWKVGFIFLESSNAMTCVKCPEDQKSNEQKTDCVPKALNYLSYVDTPGVSLTSTAIFLFIATSAVLGIFVKYWDTPIVKASNRNLSCLLLISLMLCFLCTLLFIGRPTKIFCLVQQVAFGVIFTISVSTVLAKTLTVIIAFNATKPGSKLKKYVGTQLSILVVFVCFLGESIISVVWMASSPPFPDVDTYSEADTIILLCNQGSIIFIFSIIGYIGALAVMSFIAAFLAKDFPDRFNEAKNITFSMLVFCSVWVTFVPAYLSSKGSRMVAVEIFAILFSSAGLLTCIFAPKCYIIFLRPELNIREIVVRITSY
ncbi:hypothetical protein XELAEV_18028341mg [Xenopus laevis]|uniref:G-protein coupled receptors family 3 profile domain-containing protein n=1 Tax=Xenopus laevis TaxID=8355 RepID=A0A974CX77_XENLA|nr:hypothetical protein XELAEV_18028341mg [Xenopus laevis]